MIQKCNETFTPLTLAVSGVLRSPNPSANPQSETGNSEAVPVKTCSRCKLTLPLSDYYIKRRYGKPDYVCKKCSVELSTIRANSNKEQTSARNRRFKLKNADKIAKQGAEYRKRNRAKINQRYRDRYATETEKYKARTQLGYAIRNGNLTRPNFCEKCGKQTTPQGHHHDYSKPLEVQWLCQQCHSFEHRKYGKRNSTASVD